MTKTMILCIGNKDQGDDGVGPYIARHIKPDKDRYIINAGSTPENYTSIIKKIKPDKLIIIDATDMNLPPGTIRQIPLEMIKDTANINTHNISLHLLIEYLRQYIEDITFIGIQPARITGRLSKTVKENSDRLIRLIENREIETIEELKP